jgi:hypothetical protein
VGRSLQAYLALAVALGLSGCLLFTDPINKAPSVTIISPSKVTRGMPADFTAKVTDDKDGLANMTVQWCGFEPGDKGCDGITSANWDKCKSDSPPPGSGTSYEFKTDSLAAVCLCVRATDHNGASGLACHLIEPENSTPEADIRDVSGASSAQPRPLCSQIHLSAENSRYPLGDKDKIEFNWTLQYSGTDSAGTATQLGACDNVSTKVEQHRCFYAAAPGTYTVKLAITDIADAGGAAVTVSSLPATFEIPVNVDAPPCLQRTDPDVYAQRILLTRITDLGGTYQSRTLKVLSVADDCEPYPVPAESTKSPTKFLWSVYDETQATPKWVYQTDTSDSFTVSQDMFRSALPGDTVKVRVEVQDTPVQKLAASHVYACSSDQVDICCGANACTGDKGKDCIRWTTWTVQFQP